MHCCSCPFGGGQDNRSPITAYRNWAQRCHMGNLDSLIRSLLSIRFHWPPPWRQTGSNRGSDPCSEFVWLCHQPIFCVATRRLCATSQSEAITDPRPGLSNNLPAQFRYPGHPCKIVPTTLWVNARNKSVGRCVRPDADKKGCGEKGLESSASNG